MNASTITFPPKLFVGEFEQHLIDFEVPDAGDVVFDLSQVTRVETPTLVLLLAWIVRLEREGRTLRFNLPKVKNVRDFLRSWLFPEAVEALSIGRSLRRLTTPESHQYFGENEKAGAKQAYSSKRLIPGYAKPIDTFGGTYIPLQTYDRSKTAFSDALALLECDVWSSPLLQEVLSPLLTKDPSYLARDVVFEAMANAVRHPEAKTIVRVSHIEKRNDRPSLEGVTGSAVGGARPFSEQTVPSHITLCWWDDGKSIIDTLREPLSHGSSIRSILPEVGSTFDFRITDKRGTIVSQRKVELDVELNEAAEDELLLLAAVFPGVTRDPDAVAAFPPLDLTHSTMRPLNSPGMGLHYLMNAAIDLYGGTVSFRTKNYFLNIKKAKKQSAATYGAKIIKYSTSQSIPGNMITVRLPLAPLM